MVGDARAQNWMICTVQYSYLEMNRTNRIERVKILRRARWQKEWVHVPLISNSPLVPIPCHNQGLVTIAFFALVPKQLLRISSSWERKSRRSISRNEEPPFVFTLRGH